MRRDPFHMAQASREKTIASVRDILAAHAEIRLAYLYGSFSRDDVENPNDIDIGIYVDDGVVEDPWFRVKMERELERLDSAGRRFDVRILNHASIPFSYRVIFRTPRLVTRDESFRVEYETRVMLAWYDMEPTWDAFFKVQAEALSQ
jgi:predicted nucleotidyltransferase